MKKINMYTIAICDDSWRDAERLKNIILKAKDGLIPEDFDFCLFSSGRELAASIDKGAPIDLLILDMQMPGPDGDETAAYFRKHYPDAVLIFCSGVHYPTVKSFESNAYRFLLKEYSDFKMIQEMKIILTEMRKRVSVPSISLSFKGAIRTVRLDEIIYVSGRKYGSSVYIVNKEANGVEELLSNRSVEEIYGELQDYNFAYPHNSYFVNLFYVKSILNHEIELKDGKKLTASRSKEKEFREKLMRYLTNKY